MGFESLGEKRGGMASVAERLSKFQFEAAHSNIERRKINIDDFADMYSAESRQKDKDYVARRQAEFKLKENHIAYGDLTFGEIRRVSECAEDIILRGIDSGWISNTVAVKTSDLDDIAHGMDVIFEHQKEYGATSHFGLGVDVTCAKSMYNKLHDIKKIIDDGELPMIKYFQSGNFKGKLSNIPKVVAAIDVYAVERLEKEMAQGTDLSKHPIRLTLLKQFEMQLDAFIAYAKIVKPNLVPTFSVARANVRAMAKDLEPEFVKHASVLAEHPTLNTMRENLNELFPTRTVKPKMGRVLKG